MSKKLNKIAEMCKGSVSLEYRSQSSYYETLEQTIVTEGDGNGEYYHVSNFLDGELDTCLKTDEYWCLHFYPNSPVGFYHALSHDLDKLLDWALEILLEGEK